MPSSSKASFRCPTPLAKRLKKKGLYDTKGYLHLIELGLEMDAFLERLGGDFEGLMTTVGNSRVMLIRECVEAVIEMADADGPVMPPIMDAFALGLKRSAQELRRQMNEFARKSEQAAARGDKAEAERFKEEADGLKEAVNDISEKAEIAKRPLVRATPEILALLEQRKRQGTTGTKGGKATA